ncbi:uncharacterized protein QC761_104770 [Podospora bellae-mahoneyi]|uniref:Zonadhesin n=1 Tax=Podospora bellae-mahoneyi TaxID=2093777 RepID=A0ABR0FVV7_9PEZI|nr:hypothetical protein QC761_104770 [Podospora bellae-mahoneyi]
MQQPLITPRDDRAAYEYSIQATEDYNYEPRRTEEQVASTWQPPAWRPTDTPNYKPKPLRWPFVSGLMVLLVVAIALIIFADKSLPNSDTSARFLGLHSNASQPVRLARDVLPNNTATMTPVSGMTSMSQSTLSSEEEVRVAVQSSSSPEIVSQATPTLQSSTETQSIPSSGSTSPIFIVTGVTETERLSLSASETMDNNAFRLPDPETSNPSSVPSVTISQDTSVTASGLSSVTAPSSEPVSSSTSATSVSGMSLIPISVSTSYFTRNVTVPVTTILFTSTFTRTRTSSFSSASTFTTTFVTDVTDVAPTTVMSFWSSDGSEGAVPISTGMGTGVKPTTIVSGVTTTVAGVSTATDVVTSVFTSTLTGVVIPSVGQVTITYFQTVMPVPVTEPPKPVKVTGVEVIDGTVIEVIKTQGPVVVVVPTNEVQTRVVEQEIRTGVVRVGGSAVTNVVVITPTPGVAIGQVTNVDGAPRTIQAVVAPVEVGQPVTYTVVDNVGGSLVSQVVVTTPAGPPYQPVSYTVVREQGGSLVTQVVVTIPTGPPGQLITYTAINMEGGTPVTQVVVTTPSVDGPFVPITYLVTTNIGGTPTVVTITPAPTTFVTTIDGTTITRVTTPPVTSFTTTIDGTLTTLTLTTTPTNTSPITLTLATTSRETLSTFTSTIPPTTFLTTISGSLRTITSTPSPTTSLSTRLPTTLTYTSTTTPTPSSPSESLVPQTRVISWSETDIFLGTFLPALLAIAIVIPLRIIDLNAKLYQPFQSLTLPTGGLGANTLLVQYSGVLSFVTPVITLLQAKHPVPFVTTLMVGCGSLMVPFATEAVGLKLHGDCYLNTASKNCGPALGVNRTAGYVLVGLMVVVVVLLGVVMWFTNWGRKGVTGVRANPWNLAGMGSLLGGVRSDLGRGHGKKMRYKRYGMGWYRNRDGREDYGMIVLDEAGQGLQQQQHPTSESESDDMDGGDTVADLKTGVSGSHLPFMTLRIPWRVGLILFQLAVFIFIIYYHAYYRGGIKDNGKLWTFMNANTFGVRFLSAIIGVIVAFCWQSFFLSVSTMTPFQLMALSTQPASRSILFSPNTNPFSGLYSAIRNRHMFLLAVSIAAIMSEFLPVLLSNVPFSLYQTSAAATACAVLSCLFLAVMLAVLGWSFWIRYPPMPADPRSIAGMMYYLSQSPTLLADLEGISSMDGAARRKRIEENGGRYYYGVLPVSVGNGLWESQDRRRLGVEVETGGGSGSSGYEPEDGTTPAFAALDGPAMTETARRGEYHAVDGSGDGGSGELRHDRSFMSQNTAYQGHRIDEQPAMYG